MKEMIQYEFVPPKQTKKQSDNQASIVPSRA
jgi:hypothetical protein